MDKTTLEVGGVVLLAFILVGLFLIILVWRILRVLYRTLVENWGVFGATPQARLVGLGVAVAVFPGMVGGPFNAVFRAAQTGLTGIAAFWNSFGKAANVEYSLQTVTGCFAELASLAGKIVSDAASLFEVFPLVLGVACWSFVGQLLGPKDASQSVDWSGLIRRLPPATWKNIALFVVLFFGVYLSIAAITAIPSLQKAETPVEADKERLKGLLTDSRLPQDRFEATFQIPQDSHPFLQLKRTLGMSEENPPADTSNAIKSGAPEEPVEPGTNKSGPQGQEHNESGKASKENAPSLKPSEQPSQAELIAQLSKKYTNFEIGIESAKSEMTSMEDLLNKSRAQFEPLRNSVYALEGAAQSETMNAFDSGTVGHIAPRQRSTYIQLLGLAFQDRLAAVERPLRDCSFEIRALDSSAQYLGEALSRSVKWDINLADRASRSTTSEAPYFRTLEVRSLDEIVPHCEIRSVPGFLPPSAPNAAEE